MSSYVDSLKKYVPYFNSTVNATTPPENVRALALRHWVVGAQSLYAVMSRPKCYLAGVIAAIFLNAVGAQIIHSTQFNGLGNYFVTEIRPSLNEPGTVADLCMIVALLIIEDSAPIGGLLAGVIAGAVALNTFSS